MKKARFVPLLLIVVLAASFLNGPGAPATAQTTPEICGLTTLDGTIKAVVVGSTKHPLVCGPGQPLVVREDLAVAFRGRRSRRVPVISYVSIADVQLADEESPLRAEWADKCMEHPATSAFRPHETMVPHLMNAHVQAANAIAARGGPILGDDFAFTVGLGDLADNNQFNEIRWIIDLFDGNQLVNPDSGNPALGGDSYHGAQTFDPEGADSDPLTSPVPGQRIVELANEPFWAEGLHHPGRPMRWFSVPGNHDMKVQGTMPNEPGWRQSADAWARGGVKIMDVDPQRQNEACEDPFAAFLDPDFATDPGTTQAVPPDQDRHLLTREQCVRQHFQSTGGPDGHGSNW